MAKRSVLKGLVQSGRKQAKAFVKLVRKGRA